tara:strand:+ start:1618 stop:1902 length:285 start_codon:yes stop_codon:yes gene_type:complete
MRSLFLVSLLIPFLLIGCASDSGIVSLADGRYLITKQAGTGFPGTGEIKVEALKEAELQCAKYGESPEVIDLKESQPPYLLGNYPTVELTFSCR